MYKDIDVVVDCPAFFYWEEISKVFPDCKFIFYEREVKSWTQSMRRQFDSYFVENPMPDLVFDLMLWFFSPTIRQARKFMIKLNEILWNCGSSSITWISITGQKMKFNEMHTVKRYQEHNANFLRNCPKDKRLVLEQEDFGKWEPICQFMDKPIPEEYQEGFPHENKNNQISQELGELIGGIIKRESRFWIRIYILGICLFLLAWIFSKIFAK